MSSGLWALLGWFWVLAGFGIRRLGCLVLSRCVGMLSLDHGLHAPQQRFRQRWPRRPRWRTRPRGSTRYAPGQRRTAVIFSHVANPHAARARAVTRSLRESAAHDERPHNRIGSL